MIIKKQFYIDGAWVDPVTPKDHQIINPATEEAIATISVGSAQDVDIAVAAAKRAFETFSLTSREERIGILEKIIALYGARLGEIAEAISIQMGAPMWLASAAQAPSGLGHFMEALKILKSYEFESKIGNSHLVREPIGVCALITPWNWPMNQIACKVAPALATGCTMVLKPSENTPLDAMIFAQIVHEAGVPKGVFNLINGDGIGVGVPLSSHKDVDFVSFTGSTRAGVEIAKNAAPTVKRIAQELGGKSPNIILADADITKAVTAGIKHCFGNSGQSCNAPTRMFVPRDALETVKAAAKAAADSTIVANPSDAPRGAIGPISNARQFEKVQGLIATATAEGLEIVAGGIGRPDGFNKGYFVRPTVVISPDNKSTLAQEEVFGPVLTIIPYDSEDHAVEMANDTVYGLAGYVQSGDVNHARAVAKRIRAGNININGASGDLATPFGGFKQSGTGREWGEFGFEEFLEVKAVSGWGE